MMKNWNIKGSPVSTYQILKVWYWKNTRIFYISDGNTAYTAWLEVSLGHCQL